ncbi:MAG: 16S rRNA (cytidine(1402)-2'-O)-methyltransferase [Parcubacteria group bacterium CG1_02_41_12]|nr:MAG: 16S rRNA (cytidine(1402)-2'-O)-methyltransferase [Parcubacteria group bacterium CG1_02_41_12]PIQ80485.1 MAG: 16S rRNA (cytidine(1402)-2'-O)-methyltransferase [Parcubacteria group bacterium CG11_big_fil_rev_8_21_14_0_20_41_14]PIR56949.1 MAG: 16S rRNA (cytidine(1402)-2'-O)-methyltransferase [Parcubacteria group bacterium CG10_big_fil_rev_8_21_14_0_10_41_35]
MKRGVENSALNMPDGMLYIVATPIGNLSDISQRSLETLKSADCILCEDTRVTRKLLARFDIETETLSFHQHSSLNKIEQIIEMLSSGKSLALATDAGTPGISDPGGKLVEAVVRELPYVNIVPIPGPSAIMSALSISGFWADSFVFLGFPPHKKGRETWFKNLQNHESVIVFYESVHRVKNCLERVSDLCPDRPMILARELTKKFETIYRGTASGILNELPLDETKGEFVVVLDRTR